MCTFANLHLPIVKKVNDTILHLLYSGSMEGGRDFRELVRSQYEEESSEEQAIHTYLLSTSPSTQAINLWDAKNCLRLY
jgi:hypothetical protein